MIEPYTPELVCPAGTPAALRTAVDAGADTVYVGFKDETNARNFPGLNFSKEELKEGIAYAHKHGARVFVAVNTFPQAGRFELWRKAVENSVECGADAVIVADIGLAAYCAKNHPDLRLHLSVQASASNPDSIRYYVEKFGIKRVVLPRVLTVQEIKELNQQAGCETEVFAFGGLCVMAEGRCSLSSYATGLSPNMNGVCSPASHVRYKENSDGSMASLLGEFVINRFSPDENAGYPTLCKGRYKIADEAGYIFEEPTSLNAVTMLSELLQAGVKAFKIEGRQRSRAYVRQVVEIFRAAVDAFMKGRQVPVDGLITLAEGQRETHGAYKKSWR